LLGLFLVPGAAGGCADAGERYQDFSRRAAEVGFDAGLPGSDGPCEPPAPHSITARALIAVETTLGAGMPILFVGEMSTPGIEGATHVQFHYRALSAMDRSTPVGARLDAGPFPISADGSFVAELPEDTLDGSANPILPGVPITSQLTLAADICGVRSFYCGTVTGTVTDPVRGTIAGQFGLTVLEPDASVPARPRYGCDENAIAPAL
jgi:hypothetical protein